MANYNVKKVKKYFEQKIKWLNICVFEIGVTVDSHLETFVMELKSFGFHPKI